MKLFNLVILTLLYGFVLSGCENDKIQPQADRSSFRDVLGVWQDERTGELLLVNDTEVFHYHSTVDSCISTKSVMSIGEADRQYTKIALVSKATGQFLILSPDGFNQAKDLVYIQREHLPDKCNVPAINTAPTALLLFDHVWQAISEHSPSIKLFASEFNESYQENRNKIQDNTSESELFTIFTEMLSVVDDPQVEISANIGGSDRFYTPAEARAWHRVAERVAKIESVSYEAVDQHLIETFNGTLEATYAVDTIQKVTYDDKTAIAWSRLDGNIGYLQVNSFSGYGEKERDFTNDIAQFLAHIDAIVSSLDMTESLILDLRFSRGGEHELALALASYFGDSSRIAYRTDSPFEESELERPFPHNNIHYSKSVAIIQSASTEGAAEILSLSLSGQSNVKIIGERSRGALAHQLSIALRPGWEIRLPYSEFYSSDTDTSHQAIGIPVDINCPSSSYQAVGLNILHCIHLALEELGVDLNVSEEEYIASVEKIIFADIPGFASAHISPTQVELHAFGYADIAANEPTTIDTPFKIASISKTFIGTSAAQMLERGLVELEWTLDDIAFPISVDGASVDNSSITLRHLTSHTSGIIDGDQYNCSYVLDDDSRSLTGAFDLYPCMEPLSTDTQTFLAQYLQRNGSLFSVSDNFSGYAVDSYREYSNVAASLAAEFLHHASGIPFDDWTQENIFDPLGMTNTAWFNSSFDEEMLPAQPYALLDGEIISIPQYSLATWADGDLRSSVHDLSRYLQAIINNGELDGKRILEPQSVSFMLENKTDHAALENQGLFWLNDGIIMGHSGGDPGTMAHMYYDRFNQVGYITLLNVSGEDDEAEEIIEQKFELLNYLAYQRALTAFKNSD